MGSGSNSSSLYKIKSRVDMYEKAKNGPGNLNKIPGANRHSYLLRFIEVVNVRQDVRIYKRGQNVFEEMLQLGWDV